MTIIPKVRTRLVRSLLLLPVAIAAFTALSCDGIDKFPLPDEFEAALVTGEVCMPNVIATGTTEANGASKYPVRIETCVYRCVEVDRSSLSWHYGWQCQGSNCFMGLLVRGTVRKVKGEKDCDARDLADPPKSECKNEVFDFSVTPPCCIDDNYVASPFLVTVPYLSYEDAQEVSRLVEDEGMSPYDAAQDVVGLQNYPDRQFTVMFDPTASVLDSTDQLTDDMCHKIEAP